MILLWKGRVQLNIDERLGKLYEMGYQVENKTPAIENHMEKFTLKKKITSANLWKRAGISKQTMHAVMSGKMKPGIDIVLKISTVLDVPVEELFTLNDSAWENLISIDGKSIMWDLAELKIIERPDVKPIEDEYGVQRWDLKEGKLISESEYESILAKELDERMEEEVEKARAEKVRRRDEKVFQRMARLAIEDDVMSRYPLRFQRVVESVKPKKA